MGRHSFDMRDYTELAAKKGLEYLETFPPRSVFKTVRWYCPVCNTTMKKSFHTLQHQKNACRCKNGQSLSINDYHALAAELGIRFIHPFKPHNIFETVQWAHEDGKEFEASFRDLKYTNLLQYIRDEDNDYADAY